MSNTITNEDWIIDSRDVIARVEELVARANDEDLGLSADEAAELEALDALAEEAHIAPDWEYGESLIHVDYFTYHIKELITDCYPEVAEALNNTSWPFRHMEMNYEEAANEAKQDYMSVDFGGVEYLILA